jgi:hypothetical protein
MVSLKRFSDYFSLFRSLRTNAKLFIETPMFGSFGKRFAFLKLRVSLRSSSDYFSRFCLQRTFAKPFIVVPMFG